MPPRNPNTKTVTRDNIVITTGTGSKRVAEVGQVRIENDQLPSLVALQINGTVYSSLVNHSKNKMPISF